MTIPYSRLVIHEGCVSVFESPEITHPSHVRHPLKLIASGAPDYTDRSCHICGDTTGNLLYHCDICKFNLDLDCAIEGPPPVALSNMKVHKHTLTLMPKLISFVCDACGTKGDRSPYICVQCDFMIFHQKCARLPRVIHVNHHDHRVSFKYPLGLGEWRCGVCWEEIDWSYGAYICSICPCYAIHSLCATRRDVWDGKELDGVPEKVEYIEPFKRNDDNTITHFAHQHNLMSLGKGGEESSLCGGCVCPIGSCTFYKCSESDCSFILHETCANLRKKKRHFLSPQPLTLCLQSYPLSDSCEACHQVFYRGFTYSTYLRKHLDVLCSSITVPLIHGSHNHHLLYLKQRFGDVKTCQGCDMDEKEVVIGCMKCDYFLDFRCATLPLTVTLPRYDDHPLTLCYGDEKASGKYWCDICERETNPKTWFYTCKDCGVTLHIFCVVGDIRYAKDGKSMGYYTATLLSNNSSSRPLCHNCYCRCPGPFILRVIKWSYSKQGEEKKIFCSYYCFTISGYDENKDSKIKLRCPPWTIGH
ncbi:DC1 [Arabidopsis suecica]|uniref:DC1 n=1 Tax=Arabidopsis suecica TaxID=45249 RepID=A0A8T1ZU24_ARASU|nr:DC1 [Arabidopsis suecica]